MTFSIRGDYFEACTCAVSCPCIFLSPATGDTCDLLFAWHVDEGASGEQSGALGAIFSGQAGGHLANVAPLIGTVAGVWPAPISFERSGTVRRLKVGEFAQAEVAEIVGMDGTNPAVITNPPRT